MARKKINITVNIPDKIKKGMGKCECGQWHMHKGCGGAYGLGFLGAAVYFISQATSFWIGVLGLIKALVWPAFVVYGLLKFFGL